MIGRLLNGLLWVAAGLASGLALQASAAEYPDTKPTSPPSARKTIGVAVEAPYQQVGQEWGQSAPGAGYTLLQTIPAASGSRLGVLIQAQCTAGLLVAFQDATSGGGGSVPSYFALSGAAAAHGQGGSLNLSGVPYSGQIKIFSTDPTCPYAAWIAQ